jgi:hypothetical protein
MTDTKDKTLDEILERVKNDYPFGCATNVTDWAETACKMGAMLGFEKGKQAGQIAAGDLCAKNLCGGFQRGRDEILRKCNEHKNRSADDGCIDCWRETCLIMSENYKEKIAALEKTMGFIEEGRMRTEQFNNELKKENARLRESSENIKSACESGRIRETITSLYTLHALAVAQKITIERISGSEKRYQGVLDELQKIIDTLKACDCDGQVDCDECVKKTENCKARGSTDCLGTCETCRKKELM